MSMIKIYSKLRLEKCLLNSLICGNEYIKKMGYDLYGPFGNENFICKDIDKFKETLYDNRKALLTKRLIKFTKLWLSKPLKHVKELHFIVFPEETKITYYDRFYRFNNANDYRIHRDIFDDAYGILIRGVKIIYDDDDIDLLFFNYTIDYCINTSNITKEIMNERDPYKFCVQLSFQLDRIYSPFMSLYYKNYVIKESKLYAEMISR